MKFRAISRPTILVLAALACGGGAQSSRNSQASAPAPAQSSAPRAAPGALRRYAALKVMLFPLQGVRGEALPSWKVASAGDTTVTRGADRAFEEVLGERGLGKQWIFPHDMQRSARRNPTYVSDPYDLRAGDAIRYAIRKRDEPLGEPFASQLRALAGVSDSRYAIIPIELRFEPAGTMGRAILRVAAVDSRGAQVVWVGEVVGDDAAAYSPAVLATISQRFADLVVPR
ncbi:MAG: hypothetical protein ABIT38_14615 [Gemmatimonadaceae bacterium]